MGFCKRKNVECECLTNYSSCDSDNCHRALPDVEERYLGDGYCHEKSIYCDLIYSNPKGCKVCSVGFCEPKKENSINFTPDLNEVTGIVDTETNGKKFAIGTKNHADTFVLNFSDRSCLLFTGDWQPVDLRKFNFDEFTSIEINGNKFIRYDSKSNTGTWSLESDEIEPNPTLKYFICSECGRRADHPYPFCAKCGAKMHYK